MAQDKGLVEEYVRWMQELGLNREQQLRAIESASVLINFDDKVGFPLMRKEEAGGKAADARLSGLEKEADGLLEKLRQIRIQAKYLGIELPAQAQSEKMAQKRRKRASPDHVTSRRSIVWATWRSNPEAIGNDLDLLTCRALDRQDVPVPKEWEIDSWEAGYKHYPQVRQLIHKMFSGDRRLFSSV